eukprot:GEMP01018421.1.p1 GENE.GEMP01018421.1~~GEMP01018421.1.p1  ORF type:complete len:298 (+),score=55.66 GEMP01018421.1:29-922(+)
MPYVDDSVESVQLEAQVIMRISKHCRQQAPLQVMGHLLGLDVESSLHATACFAYKAKQDDAEENQDEATAFQMDMLRSLREVNVDSNAIGWYCSTYMGNFITDSFIETQLATQKAIPKSVALVYDPLQAAVGKPAFKAYRLDIPRSKLEDEKMDSQAIMTLSEKFLKEVPVTIRCSPLVEVFLHEYVRPQVQYQFDTLNLDSAPFMENSMRYLIDSLEEFQSEQQRMQLFERQNRPGGKQQRYPMNAPQQRMGQPRPTDQLLIGKQIQSHCGHIEKYAGDSFSKLFLVSRENTNSKV